MIECESGKERVRREKEKKGRGTREKRKGKMREIEKKRERVYEQLIYHSYILVLFL